MQRDMMRMTYGDGDSFLTMRFDRLDPDELAQMMEVIEINLTHTEKTLSVIFTAEN